MSYRIHFFSEGWSQKYGVKNNVSEGQMKFSDTNKKVKHGVKEGLKGGV